MRLPDGRDLIPLYGVIPDPSATPGRIILWIRGDRDGKYQLWERVSSMVNVNWNASAGLRVLEVSSTPVRQWVGSRLGKLFIRRGSEDAVRRWTLPDGETAEQAGGRRADLVLLWAEDDARRIDESLIRERWGPRSEFRAIGHGVYLVRNIVTKGPDHEREVGPDTGTLDSPIRQAEQALELARAGVDPRREVIALADLGLAYVKKRDPRGEGLLDEALTRARRIGDHSIELGILCDQGLAALASGRPDRARDVLGPLVSRFRTSHDWAGEKLALDRLGRASANLGDSATALACFAQALEIARELGDVRHEADLLWLLAIQNDALGRRDEAEQHAQFSVDLMRRTGRPQTEWYAHHLAGFRSGAVLGAIVDNGPPNEMLKVTTNLSEGVSEPGSLRMALSATKSMAKFLGSGFKTSSTEVYRERTGICESCEYHTGLRCRVCGCFTVAKARLQHEKCPTGKWPK